MNENDFKKRFGSNSPLPPYNWSDDDYASGWNITGDMPPTRQQFDALQRTNDDKAAYLLDKVYSSARLLRRSTHYSKGDRVYAEGLKAGLYLECATAGMSGTDAIDFSSAKVGDAITDGGVTWTVVKYALTTDVPPLASALATPRKIELTGKAEGSTSFDGSANASINVTSVNADTASKLATPRKIELTGNVTGSADFDGSKNIQIATSLSDAYLPLAGGEVTGAVNFKGGATGNWTGTVGGGHVAFEDTIIKNFDSKQDQNNDFVFACNVYNSPMFLVSVVTFIYRNTGSSQSIRHFGVLSNLPSGWEYNWLYSKEFHNFIDYIGSTYVITVKSTAPLTINVSFKAQSQDTNTQSAYTRVWVKKIGE